MLEEVSYQQAIELTNADFLNKYMIMFYRLKLSNQFKLFSNDLNNVRNTVQESENHLSKLISIG